MLFLFYFLLSGAGGSSQMWVMTQSSSCPSPVPFRLLSLLPPGLRQVCPGLHLQRGFRQMQLLPLKCIRCAGDEAQEACVQCISRGVGMIVQ